MTMIVRMQKTIIATIMLCAMCAIGHSQVVTTYEPENKVRSYSTRLEQGTYDLVYDTTAVTPGELIRWSGKLRNYSIVMGLAGGVVSGALIYIGATGGNDGLTIGGVAVGTAAGIACLIMNIAANNREIKAGNMMKKISITGDGVTVKF